MFYKITACNTTSLFAWASNPADVARWVDWLNRDREVNLHAAHEVPDAEWPEIEKRDDVMSMDEPGWDDFMPDESA